MDRSTPILKGEEKHFDVWGALGLSILCQGPL